MSSFTAQSLIMPALTKARTRSYVHEAIDPLSKKIAQHLYVACFINRKNDDYVGAHLKFDSAPHHPQLIKKQMKICENV